MSMTQQYRATIQKLKKRIRDLEHKEEQGRKKLKRAMTEARKVAKSYKSKLNAKVRGMKGKSVFDMASVYARTAMEMERKLLKAAETKAKALTAAIVKMDKEYITRLIKDVASKARKSPVVKKIKKKMKR